MGPGNFMCTVSTSFDPDSCIKFNRSTSYHPFEDLIICTCIYIKAMFGKSHPLADSDLKKLKVFGNR